jgi:hypothetical protein
MQVASNETTLATNFIKIVPLSSTIPSDVEDLSLLTDT